MKLILSRSGPMYVAFFIAALCLFLPSDAAATKQQSVQLKKLPFVFGLAVDHTNPKNLFLATRRGLFRADHNGTATRISRSQGIFWNVLVDPVVPTRLLATGTTEFGETDGLLVSANSGRQFTRLAPLDGVRHNFRVIVIDKAGSGTLYGLNDDIWRSTDRGVSWTRMGPTPVGTIDIAMSSLNTQNLYAATKSGIKISYDSGRSWSDPKDSMCLQPVIAIDAGSDGVLYAFSLCKGLVKIDGQTGKTKFVAGWFGGCIFQHLAVDPMDSIKVYAVARCHKLLSSEDGGRSWRVFGDKKNGLTSCVSSAPNGVRYQYP